MVALVELQAHCSIKHFSGHITWDNWPHPGLWRKGSLEEQRWRCTTKRRHVRCLASAFSGSVLACMKYKIRSELLCRKASAVQHKAKVALPVIECVLWLLVILFILQQSLGRCNRHALSLHQLNNRCRVKDSLYSLENIALFIDVGKVDSQALLCTRCWDLQHPCCWIDSVFDRDNIGNGFKVRHQVLGMLAQRSSIYCSSASLQKPSQSDTNFLLVSEK